MKLSIIIVSFNTKELLKGCLDSIINGLTDSKINGLRVEIIVVDNGSTDGSVEYINELRGCGLPIKTIFNKENLGFAKAVNQGIKEAEGETILLLNPDTCIKLGALEKLLEFEEKVRPAIIGAKLLNPDGTLQPSVFHLPTIKRAVKEYLLGREGEFSKYAPKGTNPVRVEAVVGGAMLISKGVIEKIGLLDESYFMYFEDLDYCRKARKAGFKIWYLPSAEIIHEHGASGREIPNQTRQWLIQSSKIYHGILRHHLVNFIICLGQKWQKFLKRIKF